MSTVWEWAFRYNSISCSEWSRTEIEVRLDRPRSDHDYIESTGTIMKKKKITVSSACTKTSRIHIWALAATGRRFMHLATARSSCTFQYTQHAMSWQQHSTQHTASMIPEVITTTTTSVSSLCMLFLDIDQSRDDSGNMMLTTMDWVQRILTSVFVVLREIHNGQSNGQHNNADISERPYFLLDIYFLSGNNFQSYFVCFFFLVHLRWFLCTDRRGQLSWSMIKIHTLSYWTESNGEQCCTDKFVRYLLLLQSNLQQQHDKGISNPDKRTSGHTKQCMQYILI